MVVQRIISAALIILQCIVGVSNVSVHFMRGRLLVWHKCPKLVLQRLGVYVLTALWDNFITVRMRSLFDEKI